MLQARRPFHQADGLDGAIINANRALSQAGPLFWVTFYGVALILAIVLGTSLMISNIRDHEIGRTEKELESMVRLLSKQFDSHLENFEAVPKSVAKYLSSTSSSPSADSRAQPRQVGVVNRTPLTRLRAARSAWVILVKPP